MNNDTYEYARKCNKKGGIWRFISALLFLGLIVMSVYTFLLRLKNREYRDVLINESNELPVTPEQEAELAEIRKREWARAYAPVNRKTTEEFLEENRLAEE